MYNALMQNFITTIINKTVVVYREARIAGVITNYIVSKDNLAVEIFEVKVMDDNKIYLLLSKDIHSVTSRGPVVMNYESDLCLAEDLVRQKDIIKSKFRLLGATVITKDGKKLGRVKNFTLDYESFKVSKLHINPRIIKRIINESLIIDRRQILEVRNDKIIIKSTSIKSNEKSINVLPAKAY